MTTRVEQERRNVQAMTALAIAGRKIERVEINPFDDGRGGRAWDPVLHIEGGLVVKFQVQETDVGVYGVQVVVTKRD